MAKTTYKKRQGTRQEAIPIEVQWRVLKRLLAGRYFETVDDIGDTIVKIIQDEMKPVKVMNYMA